jgi:hypothetical protein
VVSGVKEVVKPIPGQVGYFVSDQGNVYSTWTGSGRGSRPDGPMKSLKLIFANGRMQVNLRRKTYRVHNLVLRAFVGPCPPGMQACHFPDKDTKNNSLRNLRWDTPKGNQADKVVHGTANIGEANPAAKLTRQQAREIRCRATSGERHNALAKEYGVSRSNIALIATRRTWKNG